MTILSTKVCKHCNIEKPMDEFAIHRRKKGIDRRYICRLCAAQVSRQWYADNRDRARDRMRRYTLSRPHANLKNPPDNRGRPKRLAIDGKLICLTCKQNLPETDFTIDRSKPSSRAKSCRLCAAEYQRKRYREDAEFRARSRHRASKWSRAHRLAIKTAKLVK